MKLKYLLLAILSVFLITTGCSKEDEMTIPSVKLEVSELSFSSNSSSQSVEFLANRAWSATWDADWIAVEPSSGEASDKLQTITTTELQMLKST